MSSIASRAAVNRGTGLLDRWLKREPTIVECCGIVAYAGPGDAKQVLLNGVTLLQNRGYDSVGLSTLNESNIYTTKFASRGTSDCVDLLKQNAGATHNGHHIGIAHTRWATHGAKTDNNAHPHHDWKNRITLIHNGTIDNFDILKSELLKQGIPFKSETDTEVIANLIGFHLERGKEFKDAVRAAIEKLRGTWGLVVMHKDYPHGFMVARNGSPLILGATNSEVFVASEPLAMAAHTNEYLALNDGDVAWLSSKDGISHLETGRKKHDIPKYDIEYDSAPFNHWTVKEIYDQPRSLAAALNFGARLTGGQGVKLGGLDEQAAKLEKIKNLVVTGCGTSLYAAMFGAHLMKYLDCFDSVSVVDSAEVEPLILPKPADSCGMLALTQSGETRDVVQALEVAESLDITKFSLVNAVGSLIARMTGCGVYLHAGREVAVASTKAFTSQVVCMGLVALWFAQRRGRAANKVKPLCTSLARMPLIASQLLAGDSQMRKLATKLRHSKHLFVLGKGFAYPVALEAALKIKEISYIHAEGFGGGQLKHGPFALLDEKAKTPVILLVLKDQHQPAMINAAQQVKARGARVVCVTDDVDSVRRIADDIIEVPENGPLTALGAVIPLQMLAYHLSTLNGLDPDKPRGLAKTVTVM